MERPEVGQIWVRRYDDDAGEVTGLILSENECDPEWVNVLVISNTTGYDHPGLQEWSRDIMMEIDYSGWCRRLDV